MMFIIYPYYNILKYYVLSKFRGKDVENKAEYEIQVNDSGLTFIDVTGNSLVNWDQVIRIRNFDKLLMIEISRKRLSYIPKSSFRDSTELKNFIDEFNKRKKDNK